jgi:hypothetical protein
MHGNRHAPDKSSASPKRVSWVVAIIAATALTSYTAVAANKTAEAPSSGTGPIITQCVRSIRSFLPVICMREMAGTEGQEVLHCLLAITVCIKFVYFKLTTRHSKA